MRCCFQKLFNIACRILVEFLSSSFSVCFVSVHVAHLYNSINTTTALKKSSFLLSDRSDFHMIDSLLIAVQAFARCILTSLSVDETLLLRYVNLSPNFAVLLIRMEMAPFYLNYMHSVFVCIHMEANASCYLLQAIQ